MDAIDFLTKEHEKVRNAFAEIKDESHREETQRKLFDTLCAMLIRHETMEQKLWYLRLKKFNNLDKIIKHLISEEKDAEKMIKELKKVNEHQAWEKKLVKFNNDVERHASEEEERLFPKVAEMLSEKELKEIGREMQELAKSVSH
ncbi:hemerythrin [Coxiella burnetii]|uniref:Hypothetical cytosolic protein n=1 Tax=Coxiella burnetii (strain Dugway 5J108-111) TaxID=434922 RepID=A9KDH4_COXBN|nr:CBU_1677 family Dot/Icm type IV secretion system effector [Coxiella burnetii]ABS78479.1 hypothetical cytosolic protein [Coxiella burnetii Dugway 5J108-111]OYK80894.1 hemerythrin [Coxiella burnetii]OYK82982.1 hemerythrin [Coxiella burnetii]